MKLFYHLIIAAFFLFVSSCSNIDETDFKYGGLDINIGQGDDAFIGGAAVDDLANYRVSIFCNGIVQWSDTYRNFLNSDLYFPVSSGYVVLAENCNVLEAELANKGWGQVRVAGESTAFSISSEQSNQVSLVCTMQNAKISVEYQEDLISKLGECSVEIYKTSSVDRVLTYPSTANLDYPIAYFNIDENDSQIVYVLKANYKGLAKEFIGTISIGSAKHYCLTFALPTTPLSRTTNNDSSNDDMIHLINITVDPNS